MDFVVGAPGAVGYTISFALDAPASRGTVRLASDRPDAAPLIDPRYLSEGRDVDAMVRAPRIAREVGRSGTLAGRLQAGGAEEALDDARLREYVRRTSRTYFHPA